MLSASAQDQIRQQEGSVAAQKAAAELQIKQSEQNLAAQYQSLIQQQQVSSLFLKARLHWTKAKANFLP